VVVLGLLKLDWETQKHFWCVNIYDLCCDGPHCPHGQILQVKK